MAIRRAASEQIKRVNITYVYSNGKLYLRLRIIRKWLLKTYPIVYLHVYTMHKGTQMPFITPITIYV